MELSRATGSVKGEIVSLLNLGVTCELLDQLDKAIEWHTLVSVWYTICTDCSAEIDVGNGIFLQYLSAMVDKGDLHGQARAFSTLAGIYEETQQMTKAEEYYRKVRQGTVYDT